MRPGVVNGSSVIRQAQDDLNNCCVMVSLSNHATAAK
jgi:hypothetical protein